jgi:hypothetical protein
MSHKDEERIIGEIFIEEYNKINSCHLKIDQDYLSNRKENAFPDLKFVNTQELLAEVVRAVSEEMEKRKNDLKNLELIEVDPHGELFIAIDKKDQKHYSGAEDIILLIHLPFYSDNIDVRSLVPTVKSRGYNFREIWAVWDDRDIKPIKLA